ncbi:MAG: D-alanyl-D-alanine carboxypeptidase family protein [Ruminococcaceae bacterium]|nr:D-alanyl-D-alanine carboxypeptidase family protein [Oscillospiraceae bacterium]
MQNNNYNRNSNRYNTQRSPQSYQGQPRRRPTQYKKKKYNKFARLMVVIICMLAIVALCVALIVGIVSLVRKSDGDGGFKPTVQTTDDETKGREEDTSTEEKITTDAPADTKEPEPDVIPEFKADLSVYEMYMNPQGEQRDAYLTLINKDNPLSADYVPPDLVAVKSTRKDGRNTQKLREYAAKALEALMLEAEACGMIRTNTPSGYPLSVMSAYRDYEYQRHLFYDVYLVQEMNRGLSREDAEKKVATYSSRPGTSEHQAGLCVDMHTLPSANQSFKNQPEATWLAENCYKFGFILRYPEDKMEETAGIMYEPWHFRYVGRYHATKMHELDMCLEEYVEYLNNN